VLLIILTGISLGCFADGAVAVPPGKYPLSDEQVNKRIREYRTAEITLTIRDGGGNRLANSVVTVRQVRHNTKYE